MIHLCLGLVYSGRIGLANVHDKHGDVERAVREYHTWCRE